MNLYLHHGWPHFFGLQVTFKMTKSKWSSYIKNAKHIYIYTEYTSYIKYMLVYWREVNVVVSMNSPKVSLHISLLWNSDGRLADQTNALRIWHCEREKVLLPFRMEVVSFLFLTWFSSPTLFLYPFFSRDKLELTRLLARLRFAVARLFDLTSVVTWVSEKMRSQTGCPVRQ